MNGKPHSIYLICAALIHFGAALAFAESTDEMLVLGDELGVTADLDVAQDNATVTLLMLPGSYIEGRLASDGNVLDLLLETEKGVPVRRLLAEVSNHGVFRFMANAGKYRLRLVSTDGQGTGTVTILRNLPPAEQLAHPAPIVSTTPQSPTLQALLEASDRGAAMRAFWQDRQSEGTPMVEPDPAGDSRKRLVTFLWQGAQYNARIVGAPANDHIWMTRLADTDVWFASFLVQDDLRLSYQIAPDIPVVPGTPRDQRAALLATLQADPLNKTPFTPDVDDPYEKQSMLALENAPEQRMDTVYQGKTHSQIYQSKVLKNHRRLWFLQSNATQTADPNTVLLVLFDGQQYLGRASVASMLSALADIPQMPPVAAVLVDSIDGQTRWNELSCNDDFMHEMAKKVIPLAVKRLGLAHHPERTVVAGSSLGGLAASCLTLSHPQAVENFISLSGSFWWAPNGHEGADLPYVAQLAQDRAPLNIRAFVSAGSYETSRFEDEIGILEGSKAVADTLRDIDGVDVVWRKYEGGHDYAVWRGALIDGLRALFERPAD